MLIMNKQQKYKQGLLFIYQAIKKSVNKHYQYIYKGIATRSIYTCHSTANWVCHPSARKVRKNHLH